jgi:leucine-rich PPR motif-containing protein
MRRQGLRPDSATFNPVIVHLCQRGELARAERVLDRMLSVGIAPDLVNYSTLMEWHCKTGNTARAEELLVELVRVGLRPNEWYASLCRLPRLHG